MSFSGQTGESTLKQILPPIVDEFAARVSGNSDVLSGDHARATAEELGLHFHDYEGDTFGGLSHFALIEFTRTAKEVADPSPRLMERIAAAGRGIRTLVLYSEIAPLVSMIKRPDLSLDNKKAAEIVDNNYEFIETIVESGRNIGTEIVANYIEGHPSVGIARGDIGTVVRGRLTKAGGFRLGRFELSEDSGVTKVTPKHLNNFLPVLQAKFSDPDQRRVNCPGHIYTDPETSQTHNRRIFDILLGHTRDEIYPQYLPIAQAVLSLYGLTEIRHS